MVKLSFRIGFNIDNNIDTSPQSSKLQHLPHFGLTFGGTFTNEFLTVDRAIRESKYALIWHVHPQFYSFYHLFGFIAQLNKPEFMEKCRHVTVRLSSEFSRNSIYKWHSRYRDDSNEFAHRAVILWNFPCYIKYMKLFLFQNHSSVRGCGGFDLWYNFFLFSYF